MNETGLAQLRGEIREWCVTNVPANWREEQTTAGHDEFVAFQQDWLARLRSAGWAVPHWPAEWGGGYSLAEQAVIFEELARADAPRLALHFVSLHHAAATLLHAGTGEQRAAHLKAILDGEVWCQGFSEPGAGSDLAALSTRAVRDGDHFVVNGQKIWSSLAMYADWCLLLARTDPRAPKRKGISYFILDMTSPGIEVRPIRQASGDEHFCEIFLTDVRIPEGNLIGEENAGWQIAQSTLNSERGATMVELAERLGVGFDWLLELARSVSADAVARDEIARLGARLRALKILVRESLDENVRAEQRGPLASVIKLYYSELLQRMTGFGTTLSGLPGQLRARRPASSGWESGEWLLDYIGSWEWTIPGGTSEIQRTIIGERALGLPREPRQP
ncbi:MAG TPA: acyl-CoA dehydrogenase family protein [Amycolatopsis sp.]|nr:acyl-CoA dehydrogenase family protein [Amycolatopsis sp.]